MAVNAYQGDLQSGYPAEFACQVAGDLLAAEKVGVQVGELVVGEGGGQGVDAELETGPGDRVPGEWMAFRDFVPGPLVVVREGQDPVVGATATLSR
nr:hypothetical protein [Streptomyces sp. NBC_00424]